MKKVILILLITLNVLNSYSQLSKNGFILVHRDLANFNPKWVAYELVYPVNHGIMLGYMNAQGFQHYNTRAQDYHLGVDITSLVPGDEDLGDTLYCIGRGRVITRYNNLIMVLHKTTNEFIVSLYRHCLETFPNEGDYVDKGQPIATIGNDYGLYQAHLHFEIRTNINLDVERGYGFPDGYVDPMQFIISFNNKQEL